MAKRKLVKISWVDADATAGWVDEHAEKSDPVQVLNTYGLLIRKDKHFVSYASTHDTVNKKWSELGRIPIGMVRSIKVIAVVDE